MHPNPYEPPRPVEEPLDAYVLDDCPIDGSSPVLKTLAGVALSVGMVMGADPMVKNDAGRLAVLGAAFATLAYSASLSDKKEPSVA